MKSKYHSLVKVILIACLAVLSEYLPELFKNIPFRYQVPDNAGYVFDTSYRDAVWYFIYSLFIFVLLVIIFLLIPKENIASKIIMIGSITWFGIEFYEKLCWLIKLNDNRLYVNEGSKWQIFIILFLTLSGIYGATKYKS